VSDIFLAVDRCHVRGVSIEIRSPDTELLLMCIDPSPKIFSGNESLRPRLAIDTHHVGRKPVTIAAAEAPAMIRLVGRRLNLDFSNSISL
jgi:hypothetical protein